MNGRNDHNGKTTIDAIRLLMTFIEHTEDNQGEITPANALVLAEAAKQTATLLIEDLRRLEEENEELHFALMPPLGEA